MKDQDTFEVCCLVGLIVTLDLFLTTNLNSPQEKPMIFFKRVFVSSLLPLSGTDQSCWTRLFKPVAMFPVPLRGNKKQGLDQPLARGLNNCHISNIIAVCLCNPVLFYCSLEWSFLFKSKFKMIVHLVLRVSCSSAKLWNYINARNRDMSICAVIQ